MIFMVTVGRAIALLEVDSEAQVPIAGELIGLPDGTRQFSPVPPGIDLSKVPLNRVLVGPAEELAYVEAIREYSHRNGIGAVVDKAVAKLVGRLPS